MARKERLLVAVSGTDGLDRLWAGWRHPYVEAAGEESVHRSERDCIFCRILASDDDPEQTYVVWRDVRCAVVLNAYPYTSGHLMVMPVRHVGELEDLDDEEATGLWRVVGDSVVGLRAAYSPEGLNVGANLGRAAGAGVPEHLHVHCVPRWTGDTNFMTALAETRVLPEALSSSFERLRATWPRRQP
ncbi:MAG: HIT family protein [Acidimicrobiales bacterium]